MSQSLQPASPATTPQPQPPCLQDLRLDLDRPAADALPLRILKRLYRLGRGFGRLPAAALRWMRAEWREWRAPPSRILRQSPGYLPAGGRAVCLYASFSESGRVTEMVLRQLEEYTLLGFDVVFVTTSRDIPEQDWEAVRARCTLALQRRNYGLDFGSWSDAAREVEDRIRAAGELLLTNDSLLGPIRPLAPIFATLRSGGDGLFGLTESRQHAVHLQSFLLLARGQRAVADILGFLLGIRLSASKVAIIRRGELAVTGHMARRGHRVAALYGHADLEAAMLADGRETRRLLGIRPFTAAIGALPDRRYAQLRQAMGRTPMNPTHHFWAPLIRLRGFPFIKTELVTKNPAAVPDAAEWEALVAPDAPCPTPVILDHLARRQRPGAAAG